jgi:hypothetical protein
MIKNTSRERGLAATLMLKEALDPLISGLHKGSGGGLERLLLEIICTGRIITESEVLIDVFHNLVLSY